MNGTVIPSETSPKISNFRPKTGLETDFELLKITYRHVDGDKTFKADYDTKK